LHGGNHKAAIERSCRYFWIQTAPPREGDPGRIQESHYIVENGTVTLTDAGKPLPGGCCQCKLGSEDDELVVARQLLRSKASRRDAA